jgi:hypothetical protein
MIYNTLQYVSNSGFDYKNSILSTKSLPPMYGGTLSHSATILSQQAGLCKGGSTIAKVGLMHQKQLS